MSTDVVSSRRKSWPEIYSALLDSAQDEAFFDAFASVMFIFNAACNAVACTTFGTDDFGAAGFAKYRFICRKIGAAFTTFKLQESNRLFEYPSRIVHFEISAWRLSVS